MVRIDLFEMERMQSLHWHKVEHDLSESGVMPLSVSELFALAEADDPASLLDVELAYPLSEGSEETREAIASWYPGATAEHVTVTNGGSEANLLVLWTLLERDARLAFMVPNYLQGWGLGRHVGEGTDVFRLELRPWGCGGLLARPLALALPPQPGALLRGRGEPFEIVADGAWGALEALGE